MEVRWSSVLRDYVYDFCTNEQYTNISNFEKNQNRNNYNKDII